MSNKNQNLTIHAKAEKFGKTKPWLPLFSKAAGLQNILKIIHAGDLFNDHPRAITEL